MQQLSSRDCDKWLSMTLTMKERFSSAWRGERALGEKWKAEGNERGKEAARGLCCFCGVQAVLAQRATLKNPEHVSSEFKWY